MADKTQLYDRKRLLMAIYNGSPIKGAQICPVCGKEFIVYDMRDWGWRVNSDVYLCSYTCLRKEEKRRREAAERPASFKLRGKEREREASILRDKGFSDEEIAEKLDYISVTAVRHAITRYKNECARNEREGEAIL